MDAFIRNKPYNGAVQAVVLDWAGTAVDHGCIGPVAVFLEVFARHEVEVSAAEARAPMGLMKKDHIRAMLADPAVAARWRDRHGRAPDERDVEDMYQETEPLMVSCIAKHATPISSLPSAMLEFRRQGVKIGSSTGYTRSMLYVLAKAAAEQGYAPDAAVSSSDAPRGRPYPYMCYRNATLLEVYPLEAMVKIGDTVSDIHEGLNAGMWTIGLTRTGNELGLTEAETAALPKDELQRRLDAIGLRFQDQGAHYVAEDIGQCPSIIAQISERLSRGERP